MPAPSFGSMDFGPDDSIRSACSQDFVASGQTWGCDSQSNPACWSGACSHGSSGMNSNCPVLQMPSMTSSGYTTSRDAQLPLQSYVLADDTYDNSSFPAITEVQRAHGSEDDDLTSRIPDTAGTSQADLMETPQPLSSVGDAQRTTKRAPGGELVRPKGRRLPHNLIERRYRDNLNHQIEVLRDELPTFKSIVACTADIEDPTALAGKWPSKAVVIAAAIQYIAQLEQERGKAITRNTLLCAQVEGLQKLVRCDDCSIVKYLEAMKPRVLFGQ